MQIHHPIATGLCIAILLAAVVTPFTRFGLHFSAVAFLGVSILALPFFVFLAATLSTTSRREPVWLALLSALTLIPWCASTFLMAWFQTGLFGALLFGFLMGVGAAVGAFFTIRLTSGKPRIAEPDPQSDRNTPPRGSP
jgi:hypothetical protein